MGRFGWKAWFIALVFIFTTCSFVSYFLGCLISPKTFELQSAFLAGSILTMLIYWFNGNKGDKLIGTLWIGPEAEKEHVLRLEADGLSELKDGTYVTVRVCRGKPE